MPDSVNSDFENRLDKNVKRRMKWAQREGLTAFRLYDLDIPEWPFAVDWYDGHAVISEYPRRKQIRDGSIEQARGHVMDAVAHTLSMARENIFTKTHEKKPWGENQYGREDTSAKIVTVVEHGLRFECNLSQYLDTGLFFDHRQTRQRVRQEAQGKRFLNLFAYTGSFSVYARAGGASETTTVDLSHTYSEWTQRNFALNGLSPSSKHRVISDDVLEYIEHSNEIFDLIVLDPPSFSNSKKMNRRFEVQSHHRRLVEQCQRRLAPGGTLYFSNNFLHFQLDPLLKPLEELTPKSIPEDFRRTVHRCWRFGPSLR
jgi:23S rRNA (cytosine1962-C5)-methyltransferase